MVVVSDGGSGFHGDCSRVQTQEKAETDAYYLSELKEDDSEEEELQEIQTI